MTTRTRSIRLPAALTADTRDAVREDVLYALEDGAVAEGRLTLDGAAVHAVDAAGLGVLVLLEKRAAEAGVRLLLIQASHPLRATLVATGLAGVFLPPDELPR